MGDPTSEEWRELRARIGGLERALRQVTEQRDEAREQVRLFEALRREEHRTSMRTRDHAEIVALRRDLLHAADCGNPDCERCEAALLRLEAERPRYQTAHETALDLEAALVVVQAAKTLTQVLRSRNVGARARVLAAVEAIELANQGHHKEALRRLEEAAQ